MSSKGKPDNLKTNDDLDCLLKCNISFICGCSFIGFLVPLKKGSLKGWRSSDYFVHLLFGQVSTKYYPTDSHPLSCVSKSFRRKMRKFSPLHKYYTWSNLNICHNQEWYMVCWDKPVLGCGGLLSISGYLRGPGVGSHLTSLGLFYHV